MGAEHCDRADLLNDRLEQKTSQFNAQQQTLEAKIAHGGPSTPSANSSSATEYETLLANADKIVSKAKFQDALEKVTGLNSSVLISTATLLVRTLVDGPAPRHAAQNSSCSGTQQYYVNWNSLYTINQNPVRALNTNRFTHPCMVPCAAS